MSNRIPQKDSKFNTYLNATAEYLVVADEAGLENWDRLGLTNAEKNQWVTYKNDWNDLYDTTTKNAEKGIRDSIVISNKNTAKSEFIDWVTDPAMNKLNRIGSSPNVTTEDRAVFHVKERKDDRTTPTAPIADEVYLDLKALGGGDMRVRCRTTKEATRASIAKGAKAVELCYSIGTDAPESVADCTLTKASTKALFTFNVGAANSTKKMFCYARWIDTTNPSRSGPWTDMLTVVVV